MSDLERQDNRRYSFSHTILGSISWTNTFLGFYNLVVCFRSEASAIVIAETLWSESINASEAGALVGSVGCPSHKKSYRIVSIYREGNISWAGKAISPLASCVDDAFLMRFGAKVGKRCVVH